MKDKRLKNKLWRKRTGFDNINPAPKRAKIVKRRKHVSNAERELDSMESARIDGEIFMRA